MKKEKTQTLKDQDKVINQVKESAKKVAKDSVTLTKEEEKLWEDVMKEAKMPVELKDEEFPMGEGEVDIRKLSDANYKQIMFRMEIAKVAYLRQIAQSQVDIMRLIMVELEQLGVKDIEKATDELMTKLQQKVAERNNKAAKTEEEAKA